MGVKMGGKQATPRPSKMSAGCLGDGAVLKVGDIQHFAYRAGDPPPHFEPNVTEYIGKAKGKRQILWERGLWKVGMVEFVDDDDPKGRDQVLLPQPCAIAIDLFLLCTAAAIAPDSRPPLPSPRHVYRA